MGSFQFEIDPEENDLVFQTGKQEIKAVQFPRR